MKVIYLAGPFRANNSWDREENIRRAERLALEVWRCGAACLCPHTNTRFFDGAADDSLWLEGDLELLRRCDAILMTPDWKNSRGATDERLWAMECGLPVFYDITEVQHFVKVGYVRTTTHA